MDANTKIKKVLNLLLQTHLLGKASAPYIQIETRQLAKEEISTSEIRKVLENLQEREVIVRSSFLNGDEAQYEEEPDYDVFNVVVNSSFRERAADLLSELGSANGSGNILYLEKNGDLWHGNRAKFCYSMESDSERLKIMTFLADNKGLQRTADIAEYTGKSSETLRKEIGKIKAKIRNFLKIDDLIESRKNEGYGINPKYNVVRN